MLGLQKDSKKKITKFFKEKSWIQDTSNLFVWYYGISTNADSAEAMLGLRDNNCKKIILYYSMSDSLKYNELKTSALKISEKDSIIYFKNVSIKDFTLEKLYVRFYETHEVNEQPLYALWIFSKTDEWYWRDLNLYCLPLEKKINNREAINENNESIYTVVETAPEFSGGDSARIEYLKYNIRYPKYAREKGILGTVYSTFIVEKDGSITDIKIVKGIGGGCDEEVIYLIKNMPLWKPGTHNGKAVRVQFNWPVKFTISKD